MGSWWGSFFSPANTYRRRLRRYGYILSSYLKGNENVDVVLQMEAETKSLQSLEEVEKMIGYNFKNRSLLNEAFTHPSYRKNCTSYERLEYIGDSVLNLLIAKEQFSKYPNLPPGLLTPLRAANVDTEKLARVAIQHNFHRYIRLGTPVLKKQVLADVVESTVGAVFVDSDYSIDTTWEVASYLMEPIITPEMLEKNPVKKLFEICQKYKLKVRLVDQWSQEGTYKVFVDNQLRGKGMCREKKEIALNRAANDAYKEVFRRISLQNLNQGC
ncbi:hypothetical protein ABFS83_08G114000 [Erythranthe nasuta]